MIRMVNETEKDLNINIRNYIQELNTNKPDFMSTIGSKDPRDLHIRGTEDNVPIYGTGDRGTGIDIDAKNKIREYFNQSDFDSLIDYWNKSVSDAIKDCKQIISQYDKNNLITDKDGNIISKDAANSFYPKEEYVSPWKNFTEQSYLDARTDGNIDVLRNSKNLDYTQNYNKSILSSNINSINETDSSENSEENKEHLISNLPLYSLVENNSTFVYKRFNMGIKETTTGYSFYLSEPYNISSTEDIKTYCFYEPYTNYEEDGTSLQLAELTGNTKIVLYILRILYTVEKTTKIKHTELFLEKQIVPTDSVCFDYLNKGYIEVTYTSQEENDNNISSDTTVISDTSSIERYYILNNLMLTLNGSNIAGYSGLTWNLKIGNKIGFKTINKEEIECYSIEFAISRTYRNYNILLASLTNLIMPQYKRRVEIEDLNRNFWVISQNLTILNKFMVSLQDGIGEIFKSIFSEIIGLWDNIYSIWKSIFYLDNRINNFDKELNEIGIATSKVKVKIGYENTFYHEGWDSNQDIIKELFYFDEDGNPTDETRTNRLEDNTLMIKDDNYYFKKGDAKFFGIYPLLYKDTITCEYKTSQSKDPISEVASIISLPINSTIHPDRINELKNSNTNIDYINNESEVINNIFMDGIGSNGKPYDQTYNSKDNKLGEIIRIERKFGNIKAEDVLEKIRSKNFVLLGYYLNGENDAIDALSTVINPYITLLQYMVDVAQKINLPIARDNDGDTVTLVKMGLLSNPDFRFSTSVINNYTEVPDNVRNSYYYLNSMGIIDVEDCIPIFSIFEMYKNSPSTTKLSISPGDNTSIVEGFWKVFYKIYEYIFKYLYKLDDSMAVYEVENTIEQKDIFVSYIEDQLKHKKISFLPFTSYINSTETYSVNYNEKSYDTDIVTMYNSDLEKFILKNRDLQDNGNSAFCPAYVLFKNMREYFDTTLHDRYFYYTRKDKNGNDITEQYKLIFSNNLLKKLNIISPDNSNSSDTNDEEIENTPEKLTNLQKFDLVFKNFKKIKWDLLSADIIPEHFLKDATTIDNEKATYDCSVYRGTDDSIIKKALYEKMDKSAFFREGTKGYFGTSHLYQWQNCFGLWFEFIGEPTNTGKPIIDAEIQTYTHNMCQGNKIIAYPDSIMNTGIILSQYNTYNLDITVPLINVAGYPFDYILRFGKPYPNIVSMLYRKLDAKLNGSTIYDHIKELNDTSNYYYCKYPFINNIIGIEQEKENERPNTTNYKCDALLYPVDGYYGHETAGQEYGKPHERLLNYLYNISVIGKIGTINRNRINDNINQYYNNYFGYTYKDCQKYTISSTDLVNVLDESGQSTSSLKGGRTLWENINTESELIANISFLNSSKNNQHIGLYVSKDTTNNDYGIKIEKEVQQEIEIPPSISDIESSQEIPADELPRLDVEYTQGVNWAMPPKFQDYFPSEESKKAIYELFTGKTLKWDNTPRYLDTNTYCSEIEIDNKKYLAKQQDNIILIPHYLGNQHASNLGNNFYLELYCLTIIDNNVVETAENKERKEHTFLVSRINYKKDSIYGSKRRWINFPANILGQIFDNDKNLVRLYDKNDKDSGIVINNSSIWQERYDLFCYFNHYTAKLEQSKYVFDFMDNNTGNNFNILGELQVKQSDTQEYVNCTKDNYNEDNKDYKLILPTVDITKPDDEADRYKKYYRTYNHYLGTSEQTSDENGISKEVYSYASKYTLFLRLKEYDTDDCAYAHIDKYDALKEGQKLVPGFTKESPRDTRPFSNRFCGWDVKSK